MGHYVSYDYEEIVDGQMDDSDDAAIKTDFSNLFYDGEFQNAP